MSNSKIILPPDGRLRALTIKEPFANLVVKGYKSIENRALPYPKTMPLPMTLAIHASSDDSRIADDCKEFVIPNDVIADSYCHPDCIACVPGRTYFYASVITGLVDVLACVNISEFADDDDAVTEALSLWPLSDAYLSADPAATRLNWANGPFCLVLDNPRRFRQPVAVKGQLNYWTMPAEKQALVLEQASDLLTDPIDLPTIPIGGSSRPLGRPKASARA